ncbi:MAG: CehA/McbA family metallohydrolase [Proteobacteria bacterium]|nr:CehA/McbA family metallohydrolase [Pseudomonadota bacterium]
MRATNRRVVGRGLSLLSALLLAVGPGQGALAARQPVLGQIDLPHPYYFRELYLPQLTSGPSAVSFSPDSREVVYSMAGSLWRQRLDAGTAVQLTDGPGYDYQPDWSPDGRSVVYVTYRDGALELALLDLETGSSRLLTGEHAVNVEPRWSPDGRRLAFVSSRYHGHFHVFTAGVGAAGLEHVERVTGEQQSPLRRYYYSAFDHEISPVWTRDGSSLIYVSNRGHVHGTGGFWQQEARAGAPAHELHYEETNWRARPDLSPDGKRLLYSSYLGRNGHQLWLLPAGGGDALPISYGDWDEVGARWSPDGRTIAFLSNRGGDLALWLQDAVGGAQRPLAVTERRTLAPTGTLRISLRGEDGQPSAARVSVVDARGRFHAPATAWIRADDGYDRAERPFEAHYFHAEGEVSLSVPAGELTVEVLRGFTRPLETQRVTVAAGTTATVTSRAQPGFALATAGGRWASGDVHVHMNYGGLYRDDPARLFAQAAAEDLELVHALIVNKEQRVPDIAWSGAGVDPVSTAQRKIVHGQEYHTSVWGHLGLIGLQRPTLLPGYVGYPNTAAASLVPTNAEIADLAHAGGALVGYVHPFDEALHPENAAEPLASELPVDVALGKVDYIEIVGFADHRITAGVWYRLLNLGFRLPAAGGTDAMANYASLRGPVGMNRTFVAVSRPGIDVGEWLDGLKRGHSFATNGPLLDFTLGGQPIGGELRLDGGRSVPYRVHLASIVPIDHLEVVCNGRVVRTHALSGTRTALEASGSLPLRDSGWCVLRASADRAEHPVLDNYPYATTSPVYVTVAGRAPRSPADAAWFMAWIDRVREATERHPDWNTPGERQGVLDRLASARAVFERLR